MSKVEDFLKSEKDKYGKVYVDISYAINNISPFLEEEVLKRRKYVSKLPILKKYIDAIEASEKEINKGGFLSKLSNDKYSELLNEYKRDNSDPLVQLEKCSKCACLNCTADCKFDSCLGCKSKSNIVQCDHKTMNTTKFDNFYLDLTNDATGESDKYFVLATMQNISKDKRYIIIENVNNSEKFILYYYPGISEDQYGEISEESEFDFVVSTYQSIEG